MMMTNTEDQSEPTAPQPSMQEEDVVEAAKVEAEETKGDEKLVYKSIGYLSTSGWPILSHHYDFSIP